MTATVASEEFKKIPGSQQSFEETWGRVRSHLLQDLTQQRFDELLVKLKDQYADQIQIYEDRLQKGA